MDAFQPEVLAKWLEHDAGNLSKKISGKQSITPNFVIEFYSKLSSVIAKLHAGMLPHEIQMEMTVEEPTSYTYKNIWEELRLVKATLAEYGIAIQELKDAVQSRDCRVDGSPEGGDGRN